MSTESYPTTTKLDGMPAIIARDIVVCNPKSGLRFYSNSLSGSFSYQKKPCSILVNWGKAICGSACHAWLGKPETVLYRRTNGRFGIQRCMYSAELPKDVKWAVGAMGLLEYYDPKAEGFTGAYSDVLRDTNHTVLGVKDSMCYLIYCKSMTGEQVNYFCNKIGLEMAIMLDGGHVAAINGSEKYAKINTSQVQYYMIQGVE